MKIFRITSGVAVAPVGANLLLMEDQVMARKHNLSVVRSFGKAEGRGVAMLALPNSPQDFKQGEIIGLDREPSGPVTFDELSGGNFPAGTREAVMLAAAAILN